MSTAGVIDRVVSCVCPSSAKIVSLSESGTRILELPTLPAKSPSRKIASMETVQVNSDVSTKKTLWGKGLREKIAHNNPQVTSGFSHKASPYQRGLFEDMSLGADEMVVFMLDRSLFYPASKPMVR